MTVDPADFAANATTIRPLRRRNGTVASFDADAALGTITADDGAELGFQSIELSDGSRDVATGAAVSFVPLHRFGRVEAGSIIVR